MNRFVERLCKFVLLVCGKTVGGWLLIQTCRVSESWTEHRAEKTARYLVTKYDAKARVVVIHESEECGICHQEKRVFVWPYRLCEACWRQLFILQVEGKIVAELSFWPTLRELLEECRDNDESLERCLTFNLDKVEPEDREKLSKCLNSPAEAFEQQLCLLLVQYDLTNKLEVRRHKNKVQIVPIEN